MAPPQALGLQIAFAALRGQAERRLLKQLPGVLFHEEVKRVVRRLYLPVEVLRGDLIVSSMNAQLPGADRTTRVESRHLSILRDTVVMRLVAESILGR